MTQGFTMDVKINPKFRKFLKDMDSLEVVAGITSKVNKPVGNKGLMLSNLAQIQHEGTHVIPATYFIRAPFIAYNILKGVDFKGNNKSIPDVRLFLKRVGEKWAASCRAYINSQGNGSFQPLSKHTIQNRRMRELIGEKTKNVGGNDRLIDSGTLRNTITSEVRKKT